MDIDLTPKNVAIGLGVGVGAAAAVGLAAAGTRFTFGIKTAITQGGSPWGGVINWYLARRGVISWGIGRAVRGELKPALTMMKAESTVRSMENEVFYNGAKQVAKKVLIGYDNGPDAFRHTGGSALISYRLMMKHGFSGEKALEFLKGAGNAHERDSFLHVFDPVHARFSGDMDVFNNGVGANLAIGLAKQHATMGADEIARAAQSELAHLPGGLQDALRALDPGEQIVLARVVDGIEHGRSVTMTPLPGVRYYNAVTNPTGLKGIHQKPHPSSFGDIYVRDADGAVQIRTMAPHAADYPQPFANGEYLPHGERVRMDLKALLKPRPDSAQL